MAATVEITIRVKNQSKGPLKETEDGLKGVGDAAGKAKDGVSAFGQIAVGAFRRVGEGAVNLLVGAGQALVSWVGDGVDAAGDYEQAMNVFGATTEASAEQMERAKDKAKELGSDLQLPATSAADAGTAMLELGKSFGNANDAIDGARGTLLLAAAAQIEEAEAAEIASNAVLAFGLQARDTAMVADLLAASANASSLEVTDTAASFKMASAVFSAYQGPVVGAKDSMIDLTTAIALMGNAGIKGSDAGTSLKQMLLQLTGPSDKAKGMMKDLAERIGESGDIAYDASGKMRPLKQVVEMVGKSTKDMTDEQRNYYLTTIFGADASRAMIVMLKQQGEGWDKMREAVTRQNAAADLAGAQMQGMKGAAAGLMSQLETLTLEALEPMLPVMTGVLTRGAEIAGSFVGQVGPAVANVIGFFQTGAEIVQTAFIPAISGATAALVVYALSSIPAVLTALPGLIASVGAAAVAFEAQALAVAATVAPLVLVAAAVAGVVVAYQDFDSKVKNAAQAVLESKQWWNDSAAALKSYEAAQLSTNVNVAAAANTVSALRNQIQGETEDLGRRMAAGLVSDAQFKTEMATINQHTGALQIATTHLNSQIDAEVRKQAAQATGTAVMQQMVSGEMAVAEQTRLTAEEMDKLAKQIEKTFQEGGKAVGEYVATEAAFLDAAAKNRAEGNTEALQEQAARYAEEQAAQKAHLGAMLADYTMAQFQMGNVSRDQAMAITAGIEKEFGVQQDLSGRTFLEMTAQIDAWAASGSSDANALGRALGDTADDAVTTKQKMDELAKKYEAELVHNFQAGKLSAKELADALKEIPSRVSSEVHVTTVNTTVNRRVDDDGQGGMGGRATGGPVMNGTPYMVGERGPEVFVPNGSGSIIPNDQLQLGGVTNNYYTLNMTSNAATSTMEQDFATMRALGGA